jgi:hypothetical protein
MRDLGYDCPYHDSALYDQECTCGRPVRPMPILDAARARARARRRQEPRQIDYARMNRVWPQQQAALARAVEAGDPEKVAEVCRDAVREWNEIGAWPDDWRRFERAINDLLPYNAPIELGDLT